MEANTTALPTLAELRKHVLETLCTRERLDPEQAPMTQAVIERHRRPCGAFFEVEGPKLMKTYAVWVGAEKRILFYDSTGLRFAETKLSEGPDPKELK